MSFEFLKKFFFLRDYQHHMIWSLDWKNSTFPREKGNLFIETPFHEDSILIRCMQHHLNHEFLSFFCRFYWTKWSNVSSELQSQSSLSPVGRPMHKNWYGYKKIHIKGKQAAKCLNCSRTFSNTAKHRLQIHR